MSLSLFQKFLFTTTFTIAVANANTNAIAIAIAIANANANAIAIAIAIAISTFLRTKILQAMGYKECTDWTTLTDTITLQLKECINKLDHKG